MGVSVKDLLDLRYFFGAELIGGESGLSNTIKSIGILDNFDPDHDYRSFFKTPNFIDRELILSSYFLGWTTNVQASSIKFLKKAGASGLFIIDIDLFPKNIDDSVIKISGELNFPIIVLPKDKCSYSNIINLVMTLVFENKNADEEKSLQESTALARSILKNQLIKSEELSNSLGIKLQNIRNMLICSPLRGNFTEIVDKQILSIYKYFEQQRLRIISCISENTLIIFIESPDYNIEVEELANYVSKDLKIKRQEIELLFFHHSNLDNHSVVLDLYQLFMDYIDYGKKIFPYTIFYNKFKLSFIRDCVEIIQEGQVSIKKALRPIKSLLDEDKWHQDLIETLSTYFLDTNGNLNDTSTLLFVHTSTVKYRIIKASEVLGYDIREMPESILVFTSLAINRLFKK